MKLALTRGLGFFCALTLTAIVAGQASAATLTLKAGAQLVETPQDCEGRPCGPDASLAVMAAQGFNCRVSVLEWSDFEYINNIPTVKSDMTVDLGKISSGNGSRSTGSTCLKKHPADANLCVVEEHDYSFYTNFSVNGSLYVSCSKSADAPLATIAPEKAREIMSTIQSPWVVYQ